MKLSKSSEEFASNQLFYAPSIIASIALAFSLPLSATEWLLEEVIVTAQKRQQDAQEVGISVSAFSGEQLSGLGVNNAKDLANLTAGVMINMEYGNAPNFTVRGVSVGDFISATAPAAAVYVDGVYKASNVSSSPQMFDLDRTEILKGPQGTLWGRNTTAGAVTVTSRKPTEEFDGYLDVGLGTDRRQMLEAAFGGGLSDNIMGRISFSSMDSDGIYDNPTHGDIGVIDRKAVRAQLLFEPDADLAVHLIGHYALDKSDNMPVALVGLTGPDCNIRVDDGPTDSGLPLAGKPDPVNCLEGNTYTGDLDPFDDELLEDVKKAKDNEYYGFVARIDYDINEQSRIVSISAYDGFERFTAHTFDGSDSNVTGIAGHQSYTQEYDMVSQELRYEYENSQLFVTAGVYYADDEFDVPFNDGGVPGVTLGNSGSGNFLGSPFDITWNQTSETLAAFVHTEYEVTEGVILIVGIRYEDEQKETDHADYLETEGTEVFENAPLVSANDVRRKSSEWSYKAGVNWHLSEDAMVYFSHALGFKSGGFDQDFMGVADCACDYDDETLKSTEIGLKWGPSDFLRVNASVFHYDYDDIQQRLSAFRNGIPVQGFSNLDNAKTDGLELELVWSPIEGLEIISTAAFLDTEINDDAIYGYLDFGTAEEQVFAFNGNHLAFAPEDSYTLLARYEWSINDGVNVSVQADASIVGDHYLTAENIPFEEQDYELYGARIAVSDRGDKWELSLSGRNLNNEFHIINASSAALGGRNWFINEPRSWMANFKYQF